MGAAWALLVGMVAAAWVDDGAAAGLRLLPAALGLGVVAWLVFWHPAVVVDDDGITLVNPLRTVHVPWAALIQVQTQYALTLHTPNGRYRAWAAPGPGRHQVVTSVDGDLAGLPRGTFDGRGSVAIGDLPSAPSGEVAAVIRRRWDHLTEHGLVELGVADDTPVQRSLNAPAAVLLGLCAVGLLVVVAT